MANNDRIKQVISNLQILSDLASSMMESDIFPVSFFSQAYDLIQKINSDFQTLESEQVEMFASQMKKHQTLILSIHQQMRTISSDPSAPVQAPATGTTSPIAPPAPDVPEKAAAPAPSVTPIPSAAPAEKPIVEEPVAEKPAFETTPPETKPAAPPEISLASQLETSPALQPETGPATPPRTEPVPQETKHTPLPETEPMAQPEASPASQETGPTMPPAESKPTDAVAPPSLNDLMERKKLSDLRKAFSLNDRFRYRRELFAGNEEVMNKVIAILNNKESLQDSITFLEEKLHWDFSNPTVKDFVKILEVRFL